MARYSKFKYGSSTKYGASPTTTNLLWTFMVDWNGDGYFDGVNEAQYMIDFSLSRGRDHLISPNGQGFERYQAGKVTITLDNTDGRFNPFNTSSALYPHVTPGKSCRIAVKNGNTGTDYGLMRGKIADIQPYNNRNRKLVKIDIIDGQQFLADKTVKIGYRQNDPSLIQINEMWTTGKWVDLILERANWPENEWPRTYDLTTDFTGNGTPGSTEDFYTQLAYAWFWLRDAMESIRELENTELGTFLHDRNGNARFLSNHFTFDDITVIDESEILTDITIPQPWETLRNKIEVVVNPIDLHEIDGIIGAGTGTELLWKVGGTDQNAIPIAAGSSFTIEAIFRYQNFNNLVPANTFVDFDVDTSSAGTGSDLTSQCTVTYGEIGNGATFQLINNSVSDGFIIDLSLYGDGVFAAYESVAYGEDSDSIDIYGTRVFKLQSPWMQESIYAQEIADFLLENLKDPTPYPEIKIEARPTLQFPLDLYVNAIHLQSTTLGINKLYRIGKIQHEWLGDNGQAILTTLKLEPYFAVDAAIELEEILLSPFDSVAEVNCSGSPAAGRMEWCLDTGWNRGSSTGKDSGGGCHADLDASGDPVMNTINTTHVITSDNMITFWYRYASTTGMSPSAIAITMTVNTTESGTIIDYDVPFEVVAVGQWTQAAIPIPSANVGETIDEIAFTMHSGLTGADTFSNFYLDEIAIGVVIG